MQVDKYNLDFILNAKRTSSDEIRKHLIEFADNIEVSTLADDEFKIILQAEDPTIIFDTCAQFGRIRSVKVNECSS